MRVSQNQSTANLLVFVLMLLVAGCRGGSGGGEDDAGGDASPPGTEPQAVDDTVVTQPDTPVSVDVLANDTAADGIGTIAVTMDPAHGGAVVDDRSTPDDAADDVIVYTPVAGHAGNDSFTYTLTDADGDSDTATVLVTVQAPPSVCADGIGLSAPSEVCTSDNPCTDLLASYALLDPPVEVIETASDEPFCGTSSRGLGLGRPAYDDGAALQWTDPDGVVRYWCEIRPSGASVTSPRPLVIWVPGSGGHAGSVYDTTSLRSKHETFDLTGDPGLPGFVLVSIQPRHLHWPTPDPQDGTKSETYYRDLGSPSTNPDIDFVDQIVDSAVTEGSVDPTRIYLMGWSNGARFSALYSIARHEQATPGGNHVAAVANFSGGDPFATFDLNHPECELSPLPTSAIPLFMISRTCDSVACDAATDWGVVPGNVAEPWIAALEDEIGADVTWIRIDKWGIVRTACAPAGLCSKLAALFGHLHWPDGVEDSSGLDHEPTMLQFLADHSYP